MYNWVGKYEFYVYLSDALDEYTSYRACEKKRTVIEWCGDSENHSKSDKKKVITKSLNQR